MVVSAALLIRERGARATAISDVLAHSGAPKGSAYHYFPGGRTQLLCEAVDYAGDYIAAAIGRATSGLDLLDTIVESYRRAMLDSDLRAGCPVAAVSVETGEPDDSTNTTPILERAAAAFGRWSDLTAERLIADGVSVTRARELAMLILSSIEGSILLARAQHSTAPLDAVHHQLRQLLETATAHPIRQPADGYRA
jgi:AcrR family transcriptional regulator